MGSPQEATFATEDRQVHYVDVGDLSPAAAVAQVKVATGQTNWVQDISDMHTKFGVNEVIRTLDKDKLRTFLKFRIDFLQEELDEMRQALDDAEFTKDRADETVDALIDLCVVAIGTLDAFDVDSHKAWAAVHEKNMQKSAGVNANRPNPLGLPDLIKPAGWSAPTHADNVGLLSKVF